MKNIINYIIGIGLLSVLVYVAFYSWNIQPSMNESNQVEITSNDSLKKSDLDQVMTPPLDDSIIVPMEQRTQLAKPQMLLEDGKEYSVTMRTAEGDITIDLNRKDAPITVNNFVYLIGLGFFDGLTFHRVINGFMIQGGDPLGNGTGGPGYQFEDEIHSNNQNIRGTIAMANAGPNTNGSQFFINQVDNNHLDDKHTVFGKVVSGMDVVDKIATMENKAPVIINQMTLSVSSRQE